MKKGDILDLCHLATWRDEITEQWEAESDPVYDHLAPDGSPVYKVMVKKIE